MHNIILFIRSSTQKIMMNKQKETLNLSKVFNGNYTLFNSFSIQNCSYKKSDSSSSLTCGSVYRKGHNTHGLQLPCLQLAYRTRHEYNWHACSCHACVWHACRMLMLKELAGMPFVGMLVADMSMPYMSITGMTISGMPANCHVV